MNLQIPGPPDARFARKILGSRRQNWPGHGGPIKVPQRFVRAPPQSPLAENRDPLRHRAGDSTFAALAANVYAGLDPAPANAAAASVCAHIEDLVERELVATEEAVALGALYRPARAKSALPCRSNLPWLLLQSFLIDDRFQRRLEAGNIARVGAEIVRPEARHRTDVDPGLTGKRP